MIGSRRARCWPMAGRTSTQQSRLPFITTASARPEAECRQGRPRRELFLFCHRASRPQNIAKVNDSLALSQRAIAEDMVRCLFCLRFGLVSRNVLPAPVGFITAHTVGTPDGSLLVGTRAATAHCSAWQPDISRPQTSLITRLPSTLTASCPGPARQSEVDMKSIHLYKR
jgi:hypothetical protein